MSEETTAPRPDGIVFAGRRFQVRLETVPYPLGGVRQFEIVETPAAAAVVPVLAGGTPGDPRVVLVEQERPAIGGRTLEIPAGLLRTDPLEEAEETAARELREETGYDAGALRRLTSIYPSPGISDEIIHLFLATDVALSGQMPGPEDPTEIAGLRTLTLREAVGMAARGEIRDAKTTVGLLLAGATLIGAASRHSQAPSAGGGAAMPVDPTGIPFIPTESRGSSGDVGPATLTLESILSQEFGYANVTAYQAMEDRARIFGLYLTLVGVLAAALGGVSQLGGKFNSEYLLPIAAFLLLLAGFLGNVFFTKLIRVRQAWRQSALAMNTIKEFYIQRLKPAVPDIEQAFFWRLETLPKAEKPGTITFLVCYTTAFIGSLSFAVATLLGGIFVTSQEWLQQLFRSQLQPIQPWADLVLYGFFGVLAFVVFFVTLGRRIRQFNRELSARKETQEIEQQEEAVKGASSHRIGYPTADSSARSPATSLVVPAVTTSSRRRWRSRSDPPVAP